MGDRLAWLYLARSLCRAFVLLSQSIARVCYIWQSHPKGRRFNPADGRYGLVRYGTVRYGTVRYRQRGDVGRWDLALVAGHVAVLFMSAIYVYLCAVRAGRQQQVVLFGVAPQIPPWSRLALGPLWLFRHIIIVVFRGQPPSPSLATHPHDQRQGNSPEKHHPGPDCKVCVACAC